METTFEALHPRKTHGKFAAVEKTPAEIHLMVFDRVEWADAFDEASAIETSGRKLSELAAHSERAVRAAVAQNPSASVSDLRVLSEDDDYGVRRNVAGNPRTAPVDIAGLAADVNATIRQAAHSHPNLPLRVQQRIMDSGTEVDRRSLAQNPGASVSFLEKLAKSDDLLVRHRVIQNPASSAKARATAETHGLPHTQ